MSRTLLLAVLVFPAAVVAQEIVTLKTREGVTQSFFIANMGGVKAQAAALLFIGGGGNIRLRMEDGQPRFGAQNFLPRSRGEFIRNGILPVFLVGTSRSTLSVAHLGRALGGEVAGAVLSSSMFYLGRRAMLVRFDFATIKSPLLFVHHREDACESTPFHEADRLGANFPLVSVKGGKPPEGGPCGPFAPHGFFGKEPETVDAIAAWMLNKPYRKEID